MCCRASMIRPGSRGSSFRQESLREVRAHAAVFDAAPDRRHGDHGGGSGRESFRIPLAEQFLIHDSRFALVGPGDDSTLEIAGAAHAPGRR